MVLSFNTFSKFSDQIFFKISRKCFLKFTLLHTKHLCYRNLLKKAHRDTFDKVNNVFRAPLSLKLKKETRYFRNNLRKICSKQSFNTLAIIPEERLRKDSLFEKLQARKAATNQLLQKYFCGSIHNISPYIIQITAPQTSSDFAN